MPKEVRREKKITKKKILETKFLDKKREQKHINSDLSFASYDGYLMYSHIPKSYQKFEQILTLFLPNFEVF